MTEQSHILSEGGLQKVRQKLFIHQYGGTIHVSLHCFQSTGRMENSTQCSTVSEGELELVTSFLHGIQELRVEVGNLGGGGRK